MIERIDPKKTPQWLSQGRRALAFVRPFRGGVCIILVLTLGGAALSAVEPLVLKYLFDALGGGGSLQNVGLAVGGLLAIGLAHETILVLSSWLTWRVRLGVHLARSAWRLGDGLREIRPDLILTHPYEGGHPDHDAAAFVVHAARRLLEREGWPAPSVAEFTS